MIDFLIKYSKPIIFLTGFAAGFLLATIILGLRFTGQI